MFFRFAVFDWLIDTHVYFDKSESGNAVVLKSFICKNSLDVKQINHVLGFKMFFSIIKIKLSNLTSRFLMPSLAYRDI